MKTRPFSTMARMIGLTSLFLLLLTLVHDLVLADPKAPEWINFVSSNSTFLGSPVPVGAVVAAFDPDGMQCGATPVVEAGKYGLMPCFRDDLDTSEDEGPLPGEPISFKINGLPATPVPVSLNATPVLSSTTVTWTSFGDLWEVNLQVVATPTSTPTATPTSVATVEVSPTPISTPSPMATLAASPTPTSMPRPTPTRVIRQADLSLTMSVDNLAPRVGDTATFTLVASNAGPGTATNVVVRDLLPEKVTFVSATPSQGTCIQTNGAVICTLSTLASGAEATVVITVTLSAVGDITNTATVSANETDPDIAHNVATASISVASPVVRPVGGYGVPLNPLALPEPWIILLAGSAAATITAVVCRRRIT